ncbi:MAG: type III restriction endonuclease subunit R [Comamonadaceae bacterium CG12_big_fil_rev_8_21_14_0_65_59_15]|nr:MAG: type III restriction endonuclease subunit R [Comamonadaceae bacterium CG12_big_fil_rev_8_21_14_0_65_59_15]
MTQPADAQDWPFGIAPNAYARLQNLFDNTPGLARVWLYGSRARGDHRPASDIDLAVEWQDPDQPWRLSGALEELELIYRTDLVSLDKPINTEFRQRIERDRKIFWQPRRHAVQAPALATTQLKDFQTQVLGQLDQYLAELQQQKAQSVPIVQALRAMENTADLLHEASDFPKKTWATLKTQGLLPPAFAKQPHSSRFDGAGRAIPNVCLKVPTGGGKTLLAAASVGRVFSSYLHRHTGLVLWIVPNEAIYRQTLKMLANRDHPYRQMLNTAGAGRVKILEKDSPLTRLDVDSHLCVLLLMLQAAARRDEAQKKLKAFRDRGNVLGFTPREDDIEAHWQLLQAVPNLDAYTSWGISQEQARATKGSIVKSSLGNVLRMVQPMVVIDEGHHAYSENALRTLDGFNPCFMLELSATPRIGSDKTGKAVSGSNILVDVRGTDLEAAEMIKLPINVDLRPWADWQSCLAASVQRLNGLAQEAAALQAETNRYIRPILLVQVERTGKDQRESGFIHAEDAKAFLLQLGMTEAQIAIKTSDKDELKAPENLDLLSPTCEVRAIITKQALQEGWDCPFAYVLCALAAGKEVRAMTQLVGRILRLPHVAKTGRAALDACYVLCFDAKTGAVITAIKQSLETEGMGDLALAVYGAESDPAAPKPVTFKRRAALVSLRIFLPRVTWVEAFNRVGGAVAQRRELQYDSDILSQVDWSGVQTDALARDWAPDALSAAVAGFGAMGTQLQVGLDVLAHPQAVPRFEAGATDLRLDRPRLVRGLLDIASNAWWLWGWVDAVCARLLQRFDERAIAASSASLLERLRIDLEAERDRLAQAVFDAGVASGQIEFRLRADACDFEIPTEFTLALSGKPQPLTRDDGRLLEKSLFEPVITALTDSGLERDVACYLDSQAALQWWHRNVAKSQYGLQGWKRNKVYPDFVFARLGDAGQGGAAKLVVLETKGLQLAGANDTMYKQALLERLTQAFADASLARVGGLELVGQAQSVQCDLVFDGDWRGTLNARQFGASL